MRRDQYGGFLRRLFASMVDDIVLHLAAFAVLVMIMVLAILAGIFTLDDIEIGEAGDGILLPYYAMFVSMNAFYYTWFHGTTGQTLGKRIFGIRVLKTDGSPAGFGTAFLRWVGYLISGIPFFLGFLWVVIDRKRQGWHDKIAGTIVVNVRKYSVFRSEYTPKYGLTNLGVFYK